MAKEVRVIVASGDVGSMIDKGAEIDKQIKDLTKEDKAIKNKLYEFSGNSFNDGETTVRINGEKSSALVSMVEKYELDMESENIQFVLEAIDKGLLCEAVVRERHLAVSEIDMMRALQVLKQAGIGALLADSYTIKPEAVRKIKEKSVHSSKEERELLESISRTASYRVKYESV